MSGSEEDAIGSAPTQLTQSAPFDQDTISEVAPGMEIGRYRLVSRIGAGAMGEVWAATDPQLEREVAIKLVHPGLARDPDISARLLREARAMAKVSHRAVIAIHDAGEADGRLFLAMELVRGRTLGALLRQRKGGPGDWRQWIQMMIEAGRGLAAAHAAGVLHRDFKPDNVMVDEHGRVCVGDFGLASLGDGPLSVNRTTSAVLDRDRDSDLTMTGALLGTPAYMSLEQMYGEAIDARADQFSFCVATYEALYGSRPFEGQTTQPTPIGELGDAIAAGRMLPPPTRTEVPASIRAIVVRGLEKLPADRWPDLDTMLAALERKLRAPRWSRLAIAAAVAIAAVAIAIAIVARRTTPPVAIAHELSSIPLRAGLAVSSNGRLAIAAERMEVRDPASGRTWSMKPLTDRIWIDQVQFVEDDLVVRWSDHRTPGLTWRWAYTTDATGVPEHDLGGDWLGTVAEGDLVIRPGPRINLISSGQVVRSWPGEPSRLEGFTISPAHHRFAYLATDRFAGTIVAGDSATGQLWRSPPLVEPSGLGWLTDDTLVYGTADGSIFEVALDDAGFGTPRRVYHLAAGWPGRMFVVAGRIRFVSHVPISRARIIDRDKGSMRDFEPSVAAAELGWISNDVFVSWDRTTHALVRVGVGVLESSPATLPSEPANATLAGDIVLAALRDVGGRKLVAVSITTGATAWEHPVGTSLAARCAGDLAPPCFVARRTTDPTERYAVVALDPKTGATSGSPVYVGPLEDIAVREDGKRLLIADGTSKVREVDLSGEVTATFDHSSSTVRSVAYDPRGGVITNAIFGNSYAVAHQDEPSQTILTQSDGELMSMVRPARTSGQILILGRTITSALWELDRSP